jgi:sn-glycerol 3-phosphate transport system substrate-binding protein
LIEPKTVITRVVLLDRHDAALAPCTLPIVSVRTAFPKRLSSNFHVRRLPGPYAGAMGNPLKHLTAAVIGIALSAVAAERTWAQMEITWWHAMTGARNQLVLDLAESFNASQSEYRVVPIFKGTYAEVLDAGLAAYRDGVAPDIIQVFDVGTGVMMSVEDSIVPVTEVFEMAGESFDENDYLPGIAAYYSRPDGKMLSFPYNSSSPILFYSKAIYRAAGLDPNAPPRTWPEVWRQARRIVRAGAASCGFTSTWLTWIHLENFAAWNNLPYATRENGLAGLDIELKIDAPPFVNHMQEIADLARDGVFHYGGRTSEAKNLFTSGECGILTESSGGLGDVADSGIEFATAPLPYEPGTGGPQNTIPGGASLWVFAGKVREKYLGIAAFFRFMSQTDVQSRLHQASGYLPVTIAAYEASKASGYYNANPGLEQPVLQMTGKEPTENSRGVRAINMPELRDIQDDEFEAMLAGQQSAREALHNAVERGNRAIRNALAKH